MFTFISFFHVFILTLEKNIFIKLEILVQLPIKNNIFLTKHLIKSKSSKSNCFRLRHKQIVYKFFLIKLIISCNLVQFFLKLHKLNYNSYFCNKIQYKTYYF